MIARVLALGRSFKKLVSYLKTGKDGRQLQRDRVEWVEFRNLPTRNPDTAACMMAATAHESVSGTQTAVYHFSISCDPGNPVDGGTLGKRSPNSELAVGASFDPAPAVGLEPTTP